MRFAKIAAAASTALLCALALGPASATAAVTHAWAQDGFDAGNTGFNPNETTITPATLPNIAWRWGILSPVVTQACAGQFPPVVAGGRLFLADQGGFAAYNAATGAQLWSVRFGPTDDAFISALAVSGNTLLVAKVQSCHSVSDPDGTLAAYNVAGGTLIWSVFRDAPIYHLLTDQGVVLGTGGDAAANRASAYRVSDGHVLWETDAGDNAVSAAGRVLLTVSSGTEAVDITTGAVAWSKPTTWLAQAATPDNKRYVVTTFSGDLLEIFAAGGGVAWTQPGAGGPVAVDNSKVYVAHGSLLSTFASSNGAPGWSVNTFESPQRPIVAGGIVYTINEGELWTYDSSTGLGGTGGFGFLQGYIDHAVVENGRIYVTNRRVLDTYTP